MAENTVVVNRGSGCGTIIAVVIIAAVAWNLVHYYMEKQVELKNIELQVAMYSVSAEKR